MDNPGEIMRLCRLCLVKDQVNIPIFDEQGDIRQIFLKISSCLPVKVSREDPLPKSICDGCSNKLDLLYEFRNTSANAEKTLLSWVGQADAKDVDETVTAAAHQVAKPSETQVKQEEVEESNPAPVQDIESMDAQESATFDESSAKDEEEEEPPPPKRARRTAAVKAQINIAPDSDDEDDDDDDLDGAEPMTKIEDESEESDDDKDPSYQDVPGTSADDQPGPSGVGKDGVEAPNFDPLKMTLIKKSTRRKSLKIKQELQDYDSDSYYIPSYRTRKSIKTEQTFVKLENNEGRGPKRSSKRKQKRSYSIDKLWPCKKCPEIFNTFRQLKIHRKSHSKKEMPEVHTYKFDIVQDIYICNTCSAEFQEEEEVKSHMNSRHENEFTCKECSGSFKTPYEMGCHSALHDPEGHVTCPFCSYKSPKKGALLIHINYVHLRKFAYFCDTCGKGFNDHLLYKEHDNEHLGLKPFTCVVCEKSFTYTRYLYTHQVRAHRVTIDGQLLPNQCPYCNRRYSKPETLEKHLLETHFKTGPHEKKHLCDTCGKGFAQRSKLVIHERVHTGYKPYACQYCEKCFTKKDYLVMHERVHSGEKPYSCEYCGKCFSQGAPLRIHLRIHTGEKPYECQICQMKFSSRAALNIHKNCVAANSLPFS